MVIPSQFLKTYPIDRETGGRVVRELRAGAIFRSSDGIL